MNVNVNDDVTFNIYGDLQWMVAEWFKRALQKQKKKLKSFFHL